MLALVGIFVRALRSGPELNIFADTFASQMTRSDKKAD
jgi:hypothetical protein